MTQEELADALGLTSVHVNRTLMSLDREGLTSRRRNAFVINDWDALTAFGDFSPEYLHWGDEGDVSQQPGRRALRSS